MKKQVPISDQLKDYLETTIKLWKFKAIDRSTVILAEILTQVVLFIFAMLTFIFLTIILALYVAHALGSYWKGFGCVSLLYLSFAFLATGFRTRIQNKLIKKIFK